MAISLLCQATVLRLLCLCGQATVFRLWLSVYCVRLLFSGYCVSVVRLQCLDYGYQSTVLGYCSQSTVLRLLFSVYCSQATVVMLLCSGVCVSASGVPGVTCCVSSLLLSLGMMMMIRYLVMIRRDMPGRPGLLELHRISLTHPTSQGLTKTLT
jgi:hypothetical protein